MIWGRLAGTLPAGGGLFCASLLVAGVSAAHADELADLRAQQQVLERRIDQLAQAAPGSPYPGGPPNPAASRPSLGGSFPRSFLIPGTETSIRISGQITEIVDYWFSGGNPNSSPQSSTVGNNGQAAASPLDVHGQLVPGSVLSTAPAGTAPFAPVAGTAGNVAVQTAHSRGHNIFWQTPRESKVSFESRTPTPYGEARTYMEFDWAGSTSFSPGGNNPTSVSDNLAPRLRYAYGTLGGFLAGQANSNFSDSDATPETVDFGGNVGTPGVVRVPQIRYTVPVRWGWGGSFSVSAETPETDIVTPAGIIASDAGTSASLPSGPGLPGTLGGVCTGAAVAGTGCSATTYKLQTNPTKSVAPDITFAYYIPEPWGHLDFSLVVRPALEIQDGRYISRTFQGYGGHFSFDVKPGWFGWTKDYFGFHITAGDAIGRYLNNNGNFSLATNFLSTPATQAAANNVIVNPVAEWGGVLGYAHWWRPNLRSTISAGINHKDVRPNLIGQPQDIAVNKEIVTAHANLIWSPVAFVDLGIEYVYGHRQVVANLKGDENALIGKFAIKF